MFNSFYSTGDGFFVGALISSHVKVITIRQCRTFGVFLFMNNCSNTCISHFYLNVFYECIHHGSFILLKRMFFFINVRTFHVYFIETHFL